MKPPSLRLTTKIVLLVAAMGLASAVLTLYATWHMQRIESHYHQLLEQQAIAASQVGTLRQHVGDAPALVQAILTTHTDEQVVQTQSDFYDLQFAFEQSIERLYPLLPGHELELDTVLMQGRHMFAVGHRVIASRMRWRVGRALHILSYSFEPAVEQLRTDVNLLRSEAQQVFEANALEVATHTQNTIRRTTLASWASVLLIAAWAAYMAWRHIARPITRLTRSMQRMQMHHYDTPIAGGERHDEIGSMARTLRSFGIALQKAQGMQREIAAHEKNQMLMAELQQLTSAIPGAVFQMQLAPGQPLRLRFVSPQWAQLMGVEQTASMPLSEIAYLIRHHDAQVTAMAEKHYQHSAQTLEPVDFEASMHMCDGVHRWIKTRANPHLQADGSITFNGVWLDVTKEIMQARALEKAKRQAEQNAHDRSLLQANISHEIRTPLNAILGMTQLLLKADLPPLQREQLHNVLRASQHLRGIVNEVLDFSKIDAGQLQLESTDFSLKRVVQDVLGMCQEEASKKGLTLHYRLHNDVPDSLRGDPHRIAQILLNYVNNAIKFTNSGSVHIALKLDPSSTLHRIVLHASVQDTGPGIPADRVPLLFDAFQQADNSITRRFGGTGLGLTISRALAELMGGRAGVHSILGQGSTFWFTAVLEPARTPVQTTPQTATPLLPQPAFWKGLRVLVVDDNPLNRAVAEGMLHALGLSTETAEDGAQALLRLQSVGPSYYCCVLMDLQMPNMDGISATKALRQLVGFEALPVIAMTAHTAVQDMERTRLAGMNAHLSKPLMESSLQQTLQVCLAGSDRATLPHATDAASDHLPAVFDASAVDALVPLFPPAKLQQLIVQFTQDSLQRTQHMPALVQEQDWQTLRSEAHKLTGTAATFGLMRLGHLSAELSRALKAADADLALRLAQHIDEAAQAGVAQLQAYASNATPQV